MRRFTRLTDALNKRLASHLHMLSSTANYRLHHAVIRWTSKLIVTLDVKVLALFLLGIAGIAAASETLASKVEQREGASSGPSHRPMRWPRDRARRAAGSQGGAGHGSRPIPCR